MKGSAVVLTTSIGRGTPTFWVLPTESKHETNDSDCNEATQVEKAYNLAGGFGKVGSTDGLATLIFILDAHACALVVGVVIESTFCTGRVAAHCRMPMLMLLV